MATTTDLALSQVAEAEELPAPAIRLAEALSGAHLASEGIPFVEPPYVEPLGETIGGLCTPNDLLGVMIAPAGRVFAKKLSFFHVVAILERLITGYGRALAHRGPHVVYWVKTPQHRTALAFGLAGLAWAALGAEILVFNGPLGG
jgi:hypothetical protein